MANAHGEPDAVLILALDTSADVCSLALTDGPRELTSVQFRHERRLSERLSPLIDFLLRDYGVALKDVESLAVGLGPGSFTGVRVGVTMAKTLAFTLDKPLVGVSSLDALAEPLAALGAFAPPLSTVTPTRRTESVAAFYRAGEVVPVAPPEVLPNGAVTAQARAALGIEPLLLIGENAETVRTAAPDDRLSVLTTAPTALAIARLALPRLERGTTDDPDALVPLYVTPSPVG
jgi:tRNA threonylcarbamoyladenosine biosynthesis protein TsaB